MSDCQGCKKERSREGKPPRQLVKLPTEVTKSKDFRRKTLGVYLCEHCDGDEALALALASHENRTQK